MDLICWWRVLGRVVLMPVWSTWKGPKVHTRPIGTIPTVPIKLIMRKRSRNSKANLNYHNCTISTSPTKSYSSKPKNSFFFQTYPLLTTQTLPRTVIIHSLSTIFSPIHLPVLLFPSQNPTFRTQSRPGTARFQGIATVCNLIAKIPTRSTTWTVMK